MLYPDRMLGTAARKLTPGRRQVRQGYLADSSSFSASIVLHCLASLEDRQEEALCVHKPTYMEFIKVTPVDCMHMSQHSTVSMSRFLPGALRACSLMVLA